MCCLLFIIVVGHLLFWCCLWLVDACCLKFVVSCLCCVVLADLFVGAFVVRCVLFVVRCLSFAVCVVDSCLPAALFVVVRFVSRGVRCVLLCVVVVGRPVFAVCCLLFVVCCLLR